MASINKVILVGHVGKDPDIRYLTSGDSVASFSLATTYRSKNGDVTEWHNCSAFGKTAEVIGKYVKKGSQLYVEGRLQTRKYKAKDGTDRYTTEIIVSQMQMLGGKADGQQAPANPKYATQDDFPSEPIPF